MRALKANLILFEVISGKKMIIGVNVLDLWLTEAFVVQNCKICHIPFVNLGLPIGGDL